jgi:hypothetical protein
MNHQKGNISIHSMQHHGGPTTTHDVVTEEEDDFIDDDSNETPVIGEPNNQKNMVAIAHEASRSRTEEGKARRNKAAIIAKANAFQI